jgi:glycine dehydrogenase
MTDLRKSEFISRHIGPSLEDQAKMLQFVGYDNMQSFIEAIVPNSILEKEQLDVRDSVSEHKALEILHEIASKNQIYKSFIGMGYYGTYTPNVILRNILENPGWYTAYTPYQPEVAQGRLEMLLNFQQLIIDLTKMDIANASLLDEGTAAAEAVALCQRLDKDNLQKIFIAETCNPQTIDVVKTRAEPFGLEVIIGNKQDLEKAGNVLCAIIQYPDTYGVIGDVENVIKQIQIKKEKQLLLQIFYLYYY